MDHRISISLGVGLLALAGWTALGNGLTTQPALGDDAGYSSMPQADSTLRGTALSDTALVDTALVSMVPPEGARTDSSDDLPPASSPSLNSASTSSVTQATPAVSGHNTPHYTDDTSQHPRHGGPMGGGGFNGGSPNGGPQFSEEEVERSKPQAMEFWQTNSPERYKAIETLPTARKNRIESSLTKMYLGWQQIRESDTELYAVIVDRVHGEEKIFNLVNELKKSGQTANSSKPLRDAVESVLKLNLKERHLRLDHLAKTLKEQQDTLASDEEPSNLEKSVSERMDTVMNDRQPYQTGRRGHPGGQQGQ